MTNAVDTSKEAVERFADWAERGLDHDAADMFRELRLQLDQALARERALLDSNQEARTYLIERNSAREEAKRLRVERDQLRREVQEARSVQEAAKVLLTEYLEHGEGLLGAMACHDISWDETGAEMLPDIDGDWVRFTHVEAALRAIAQEGQADE